MNEQPLVVQGSGQAHSAANALGPSAYITVALPLYNMPAIYWLAMESLCRQKPPPVPWELVICEEPHDMQIGLEAFERWLPRLEAAGCVRLLYVSPKYWQNLARKWRIIAQKADPASEVFILQAGDCYSEPNRLCTAWAELHNGAHWLQTERGVFYDIAANRKALYAHTMVWPTALNMATLTKLVKELPDSDRAKGVDRWMQLQIRAMVGEAFRVATDTTNNWQNGLDTHGHNTISKRRGSLIAQALSPFVHTKMRLSEMLPADIVDHLKELQHAPSGRSLYLLPPESQMARTALQHT